mmetsp:Transcript_9925/g.10695  ORF Transcript_9925/g.10695 Transcript_9925/m.10695 type:complete len:260 (-) Transcript_9925:4-783(-)
MKMLLFPTLYNIAMLAVTTFLVVVVLSPHDSLAFRHDDGSSSSSHTYHSYNYGDVVVRSLLQFRGGSDGDLNLIDKDDDDDHTNVADITMDDSYRREGQHQHRDTSTTASRHNGEFVQRSNNPFGSPRHRRLSEIRSNVNQAYNNYLVRFYWSQVTKGCSLHIPPNNQNPSDTDALLAVQVRGGADNSKNNNQTNHVDEFTKGVLKILKNKFLMIVATGIVLYTCIPYPAKSAAASPALCIACGILVAEICTGSSNSSE